MKNLELYDKVREVPAEAKKNIGGGRLIQCGELRHLLNNLDQ